MANVKKISLPIVTVNSILERVKPVLFKLDENSSIKVNIHFAENQMTKRKILQYIHIGGECIYPDSTLDDFLESVGDTFNDEYFSKTTYELDDDEYEKFVDDINNSLLAENILYEVEDD